MRTSYVKRIEQAKGWYGYLIVSLQFVPSIDRSYKYVNLKTIIKLYTF
jgi:hypothetical protein